MPRSNNLKGYTVNRVTSGIAKMQQGERTWEEPQVFAQVYDPKGKPVTRRPMVLNCTMLCLPGGSVRGIDATDDQIIEATVNDESIFNLGGK